MAKKGGVAFCGNAEEIATPIRHSESQDLRKTAEMLLTVQNKPNCQAGKNPAPSPISLRGNDAKPKREVKRYCRLGF